MPINENPFGKGAQIDINNNLQYHFNFNIYCNPFVFPIELLCNRIIEANLTPPEESDRYNLDFWQIWWETSIEKMSRFEQISLRRKLGLYCWSENPFSYKFMWIDDDSLIIQLIDLSSPVSYFVDFLNSIHMSNPGMNATIEQWHQWWEDNSTWNESMKNFLWWLICPYPYEIVEVELA
ncbi:MAG: hypothetical protein QM758_20005 [Armatimonas sp.]